MCEASPVWACFSFYAKRGGIDTLRAERKTSEVFFGGGRVMLCGTEVEMQREIYKPSSPRATLGGADIFVGRGFCRRLPEELSAIMSCGRVLLVYDDEGESLARETEDGLKGFGFRVTLGRAGDRDEAEECCRVVLGVGGRAAADAAKAAAKTRGAECALFPVVPCEDGLLSGGGVRAVYLDGEVLERAPKDSLAAAAGLLYALPLKKFEDVYASKVLALPFEEKDISFPEGGDAAEIAFKVLASADGGKRYACDETAELLAHIARASRRPVRRRGEYVFASACALAVFYRAFLSSPAIDTLLPADRDAELDEIARLTGRDRVKLMQAFDFFDVNGYFRINYIMSEYRMDLLSELSSLDPGTAGRTWRRMYDDAGFWMKSAFTSRDLLRAMSLAGELAGGLLGFAAATGFFAAMRA